MVTEAIEPRAHDTIGCLHMQESLPDVMRCLISILRNPTLVEHGTSVVVLMNEEEHGLMNEDDTEDDDQEGSAISASSSSSQWVFEDGDLTDEALVMVRNALDACPWIQEGDSHYRSLLNPEQGTFQDADRFLDAFCLLILLLPNLTDIEMFFSASWAFEGSGGRNWYREGGRAGLQTSYPTVMKRVAIASHQNPDQAPLKHLTQLDFAVLPFDFIAPLMALPSVNWVAMEEMETEFCNSWPSGLPKTFARDIFIYASMQVPKTFADEIAEHARGPCDVIKDDGFVVSDGSARCLIRFVGGQGREGFSATIPMTESRRHNDKLIKIARDWGNSMRETTPDWYTLL